MKMIDELQPNALDRIICVKVGKVHRENMYEMARKYWVVKLDRVSQATHLLAIVDGIVQAVYIPHKWKMSQDLGHEGRCEMEGHEILDSEYIGKSVKSYYGKSANPVKYINM